MVRLGDICTVVSGTTPKSTIPEYWDGNINWVTPAELTEDSDTIFESQRKITQQAVIDSSLKSFPAGTVLLSSRAPIGKVAIAGTEMYCNQGFKNLICSDKVYNRYLYHFLKGQTDYLNSLGRGATFKEISKSIVENIEIPLPPLDEQRRIATTLDKVTNLISKRRRQLDKLDELAKARFVEMFGDPESNDKNWDLVTIGQVLASCEAGWSGNGTQRKRERGEIAVLKVSAVTKGFFIPEECKVLDDQNNIKKYIFPQKGDLIFSRANTREMVGATAVIWKDYPELILPDKLWKLQFCSCAKTLYMKYILSSKTIREKFSTASTGTSGSMYNVSMEKFKAISIPLPPVELQDQFATFIEQIEKARSSISHGLEKLETLKKALMQIYFE